MTFIVILNEVQDLEVIEKTKTIFFASLRMTS